VTDDLAAFLGARYDELETRVRDEQRHYIKRANGVPVRKGDWARVVCDPVIGPYGGQSRTRNIAAGLYVADMSDPDRVLADIALKRAILADHVPYRCGESAVLRCQRCASDDAYPSGVAIMEAFPCNVVRQLGTEFSGHPDYKPIWKPSHSALAEMPDTRR
jgi:Family of unknown function (DUF6221)